MQARNKQSQKNHTTPHACGRKSFARKRKKITIKNGKPPSRAELFVVTCTKSDGSYVSDEAKTRADALTTLMNQHSSIQTTSNVTASLDDEYAQVFGPERPGRIRCVGRGPTPSKFLKRSSAISSEIENSEIAQLKMQNKALEDQVRKTNALFQNMFGVASVDQASAWATNFVAAFANISNPRNIEVNVNSIETSYIKQLNGKIFKGN
ncbi:putative transposase, Ptta/En/Spm, plant [Arabidopsis thaliana]